MAWLVILQLHYVVTCLVFCIRCMSLISLFIQCIIILFTGINRIHDDTQQILNLKKLQSTECKITFMFCTLDYNKTINNQ